MFGVGSEAARARWMKSCDEEDGSSRESFRVAEVQRSQQRYGSMREQSIVGGASTGNTGGRVCTSNLTDPERSIEPHNRQQNSSSN